MAMAKARTRGAPDLGAIEWAERAMPPGVEPELEGLGARRRRFLVCYLWGPNRVRFNATRSAEAAGYSWPRQQGPRLMQMHGFGGLLDRLFIKHCLPGGVDPTRPKTTDQREHDETARHVAGGRSGHARTERMEQRP